MDVSVYVCVTMCLCMLCYLDGLLDGSLCVCVLVHSVCIYCYSAGMCVTLWVCVGYSVCVHTCMRVCVHVCDATVHLNMHLHMRVFVFTFCVSLCRGEHQHLLVTRWQHNSCGKQR